MEYNSIKTIWKGQTEIPMVSIRVEEENERVLLFLADQQTVVMSIEQFNALTQVIGSMLI